MKRALHVCGGALAGVLACAVIAGGGLDPKALEHPSPGPMLLLASVVVLLVTSIARRVRFEAPSARSQRVSFWLSAAPAMADVEIAFALVGASYAIIAVTGGLGSSLYPLLYGVIAFSVTLQSRSGAWTAVGAACIMELALFLRQPFGMESAVPMLLHQGFVFGAAIAHAMFLRGLALRLRRRRERRLQREIRAHRDSARDYRLISAALGAESRAPRSRDAQTQMLASGGVHEVGASIYYALSALKQAIGARTCILLWLGDRDGTLKVKELVTDTDDVTEASELPLTGIVGAVARDRDALVVDRTKAGQIAYYNTSWTGAFIGVPVMDGGHVRGVLCADRDEPLGDHQLALVIAASEQIVRCIQSERLLLAIERAKYEHERFYHASAMLCQALTLDQVMETAFDAAGQIIDYDIAAITVYDAERKSHRVESVRVAPGGEGLLGGEQLAGLEFRDNAGLVSMVVKNKHYLPAGGESRELSAPVYSRRIKLKSADSLVVLPLLSGETAVGTFMLASRQRHRFTSDVRDMLSVIASQVAVSVQNGLMYEKMETMATTDGLTGLTNHRTFQERFAERLNRADRHSREAAILLCDVDHFKKVNDTYGHPVGDEVLRQVARVLREAVRKSDIPARYGGEEFAVVLESTGLEGAMQLAERIRGDVGALVIDSDKGPFQVAMSIGVATFPHDGRDRAELIEHADHALYHAKETGRNRCVSYQRYLIERRVRKAS